MMRLPVLTQRFSVLYLRQLKIEKLRSGEVNTEAGFRESGEVL